MENEKVTYATNDAQVKVNEDNGKVTLVGYPVVWGAMSDIRRDGNRHMFEKDSVEFSNPTKALDSHSQDKRLATTKNNTLRLIPDEKGIRAEIDLNTKTTAGNDAAEYVRDGTITGMSIGGVIKDSKAANGVRKLLKFKADEVTITDDPAMQATSVALMSKENFQAYEKEQAEKSLQHQKDYLANKSKLDQYKLNSYGLGRVSGSGQQ